LKDVLVTCPFLSLGLLASLRQAALRTMPFCHDTQPYHYKYRKINTSFFKLVVTATTTGFEPIFLAKSMVRSPMLLNL
jgi:hypothetical protein